jgi:hypothetical protein
MSPKQRMRSGSDTVKTYSGSFKDNDFLSSNTNHSYVFLIPEELIDAILK